MAERCTPDERCETFERFVYDDTGPLRYGTMYSLSRDRLRECIVYSRTRNSNTVAHVNYCPWCGGSVAPKPYADDAAKVTP